MTSLPPSDIFWAGAAGVVTFAGCLVAPFVNRWRLAHHARRLEARQHRGYDRHYEELRELEAWVPQGRTALDAKALLSALFIAGWLGLIVYAVPNNGGWYDFGFFLGICVFGVGANRGKKVVVRERVIVREP